MTWHVYDKSGKWLVQHHGDSLLRLAGVSNVVSWKAVHSELVQPGQLPDGLLEVRLAGREEPVLFLFELATKAERRLTRQLVRDIMLVYLDRDALPEVVAVVLQQRGKYRLPASVPLESPLGLASCVISWRVVELWTLDAEPLLAANDPGLVPWVPLTEFGGSAEELLRRCREQIERLAAPAQQEPLLAVTQLLAALRIEDPQVLASLGGGQMLLDSKYVREIIKKQVEKEKEEFKEELKRENFRALTELRQRDILVVLRGRFKAVPRAVSGALKDVTDQERLDRLIVLAATCPDLATFRAGLVS